jgi:hypothetical protein
MNHSLHHKPSLHDATIRSVVSFGHEVRVQLRDSHVIVGSIVLAQEPALEGFRIRPWGRRTAMTVKLDDVARAAPIRRMRWLEQRCISSAQVAGVFAKSAPRHGR